MSTMLASLSDSKTCSTPQSHLAFTYGLFIVSGGAVWHLVADGAFSSILTLSVMVQCLGVALLGLKVVSTGSASGISSKALSLDALSLCFRLSSTLWLNGYLPADATGDHVFQIVDSCSLCIITWLLYQVLVVKRHTYQEAEDSLSVLPMVVVAFALATLLHANMNNKPLFDIFWMASLFISTVSVVPQLWLITKTGGGIEALTSHHIAAMAVSRVLSGIFMWHARRDITCNPWMGGMNHAIWAILGAHVLHLVLLGDFAFYYIKAVLARGLNCRIETTEDCFV